MADRLTTIIDIQTDESVKATAALAEAEARLKKESAELHRRLMEEARAHERVAGQVRSATKTTQDATAKLDQMIRREQLAAKIAKEHGTSVQAARRAVNAFGKDLDRAGEEASGYAKALDKAEKETRALIRAQGGGLTGAVTRSIQGAAAAMAGFAAAAFGAQKVLDVLSRVMQFGYTAFSELQAAVVSLRKVVNDLDDESLSKLVGRLEDLSTSSVPIATDKLIELGATAAQIGIQSAEGIRLAAETGAQLAEATDLSGERSIKSLARILAIQGESISSLDNLGSALVELGNTSRATEAEIEPIANEIARATANYDIGSPTILGYAAALAEMGAKAEGSGTALASLFQTLLIGAKSGKNLEDLAKIANVSSAELKKLTDEDVGQAAIAFLQGLKRYGKEGVLALDEVGLSSKRVSKALLPLAANSDRLVDRIALSNKAFQENTALSREAEAAFGKLKADVQRLENALRLVASDGFGVVAPAISKLLKETVATIVVWRRFKDALAGIPAVAAPAAVAIDLLNRRIERDMELLKSLPVALSAVATIGLEPLADALEIMAAAPGGFGLEVLADKVRGLQVALLKAGAATKAPKKEIEETGGIAEEVAEILKALGLETDAVGESFESAGAKAKTLKDALSAAKKALESQAAGAAATAASYQKEELETLETGLRTRKEVLAAVKKTSKEHKEAAKAREAEEKAAEKAAKERAEALEHEGELWYIIGKAAAQAAEDGQAGWSKTLFYISDHLESIIDGFFMLGDVLAKAGREDLGQFATGIGQLAAGDYGGGIGSIAQGFGLTGGGMSKFGGAKHGNFIAEGAALGAQYGGVYGAIIGAFAGAFVKKGADDLHSGLEEVRGRADLIITEAQGELAEVGAQVEQVLEGFFNSIQDALIANLDFGAAGLEFHIREDRVRVVVNGIEKVFSTIEEALAFAAQGVLASNATAEGLGANMRALFEHLSGPDVIGSLEELQEAFNLAADLDFQETGVTGTYIKSRERALAIGRQYGMNLEAILALEDKRIEADRRALEAQTASVFGVDDVVGRFTELTGSIKRFDAELAASEESRASRIEEIRAELEAFEAAAQEAVAGGEDAAGALLSVGEGGIRARDGAGAFRDDLDLTGATFAEAAAQGKRTREEIEALKEELAALEKAAQESLEALGVDEIGKLWTTAVDQVAVSLIDMIQAIQGPTAKIEELEEIRHRQFLFTLYAQIQQAKLVLATMEGVSQAVRVMFEGLISDAETLFEGLASGDIKFPTAGAGGRGGKAQARKQAEEEAARAAEDFNASVALMTRRLSGASDAEIAAADALAELAEKGAAAKMSAEEVAAAVGMLAELQLRELAADWTQAAEDFGKVDLKLAFEQIQERAAADLATALVSAGDNREAYRAFREAVREGMAAELQELGQSALSGGRFGLRQEARESARQIRFLMRHLRELGLTANQVAQNVRDAVIPDLLDIIKTEAQRTGSLDEYNAALAQEAQLQRIMTRIRLEGMELELRAANALTPAIQGMFDTARRLLDLPTVEGGLTGGITTDQLAAISRQRAKERAAGGTGGVTGGAAGETTADIIARLERERATELERLEMDFQALFQSIADSTGTAAEKARALALAEEDLAEKRQEIQDRRFEGLRELAKSLEAEIIATKAPKAQIEAKQAAFQAAAANVDINDDASVAALLDVAQEYLDAAANYGDLVKSGEIYNTARDSALQVLASFGIGAGANPPIPQGFGPPPGIGPPGLGGTSFLPPPSQPIIVNAPPGQAANIGALSREIVALKNEVADFKRVAQTNFKDWIPAKAAIEKTGNWIQRRGG